MSKDTQLVLPGTVPSCSCDPQSWCDVCAPVVRPWYVPKGVCPECSLGVTHLHETAHSEQIVRIPGRVRRVLV